MHACKWVCTVLIFIGLASGVAAKAKVAGDSADSLKNLTSIAVALDSPDRHPIHILYLPGINQIGSGGSALLRQSICTELRLCAVSDWKNAGVEFADKGEFASDVQPPTLAYLGNPVWRNADEWRASTPFVVHWVVHLRRHPAVLVVDEINWWPLLIDLKCRAIEASDAYLAGPNRTLLEVCSQPSRQDPAGFGRFYPWISADEAAKLEKIRPRAVLVNRSLKTGLIDWGLSDVMLTVGQLGGILRDGVRQLMAKSAAFDPNQAAGPSGETDGQEKYDWKGQLSHDSRLDQEFIGVTHSLGSYLLFNTLNPEFANAGQNLSAADTARKTAEENAMRYIFERTSLVYFFANQLELLEITNLENGPGAAASQYQSRGLAPAPAVPVNPAANFRSLVNQWQQIQANFQAVLHPSDQAAREKIQVVAFSDPSDVLTWRVPRIGNVDVVNLDVQNAPHWFWLFESPNAAHVDYAKNKDVLRVMFLDAAPARAN